MTGMVNRRNFRGSNDAFTRRAALDSWCLRLRSSSLISSLFHRCHPAQIAAMLCYASPILLSINVRLAQESV